ncbi:MAG TPA: hypothetical protein VI461_07040 [Chitinophagaceae bacterium]|nr:hypothetical protein [Chitinophagaceae bacterium]
MKKILLAIPVLLIGVKGLNAQGCSDAGFCSIHSIKNNTGNTNEKDKNNELSAGFIFGKGERSVSYYTWEIEYTRSITERTSATAKLGYSFISGELASTNGPTDLFLSVNHAYDVKSKWQKSFIVGLKIPFDKADIVEKGIHLPMPYQTSLGTTDLVLGLNFSRKSFGATVAVQQPLKPVNKNMFLPENYPAEPLANRYLPSNRFSRKGDVLLRLSYNFELNKKFSVRPSLLGIYHEANDTYIDASKIRREIAKSSGLTANANVFLDYRLKNGSEFELTLGAPFAVRINRPDGLTRSFVAALNYKFSF